MKTVRLFAAVAMIAAFVAPVASAQDIPKPGPEHEVLKKMEGEWTLTMKAGGMDFPGTVTYKLELGGLWLVGNLNADLGGMKFQGKGLDTYDAKKKKYISVWADSMSTHPMIMEGTYDKEKKTMTMIGDGPDMTGKVVKWKSVSEMPDDNTINFNMFTGDAKEPMFTIVYKRKK